LLLELPLSELEPSAFAAWTTVPWARTKRVCCLSYRSLCSNQTRCCLNYPRLSSQRFAVVFAGLRVSSSGLGQPLACLQSYLQWQMRRSEKSPEQWINSSAYWHCSLNNTLQATRYVYLPADL
jgi:hypothetical protein